MKANKSFRFPLVVFGLLALGVACVLYHVIKTNDDREKIAVLADENRRLNQANAEVQRLRNQVKTLQDQARANRQDNTQAETEKEDHGAAEVARAQDIARLMRNLLLALEEKDHQGFEADLKKLSAYGRPAYPALMAVAQAFYKDRTFAFIERFGRESQKHSFGGNEKEIGWFLLHYLQQGESTFDNAKMLARIGRILGKDAQKAILELAQDWPSPDILQGALRAFDRLGLAGEVLPLAISALDDDSLSVNQRIGLLQDIALVPLPSARAAMKARMASDPDPQVQRATFNLLLSTTTEKDLPWVLESLTRQDISSRRAAFESLDLWGFLKTNQFRSGGTGPAGFKRMGFNTEGKLMHVEDGDRKLSFVYDETENYHVFDDPRVQGVVLEAARGATNPPTRASALSLLRHVTPTERTPIALEALRSSDLAVREAAFGAIREDRSEAVTSALVELAEKEANARFKSWVLSNLEERKNPAETSAPDASEN